MKVNYPDKVTERYKVEISEDTDTYELMEEIGRKRGALIKGGEIDYNKTAKIILVKNPAGYNQAIDTLCLNDDPFSTLFMLNDNYADGQDVSWIWDVEFERLNTLPIKDVFISGIRMYDMAVRLKTAGLNQNSFILEQDYEALTEKVKNSSTERVYILATYTAMINYRKYLYSKGFIKKLW